MLCTYILHQNFVLYSLASQSKESIDFPCSIARHWCSVSIQLQSAMCERHARSQILYVQSCYNNAQDIAVSSRYFVSSICYHELSRWSHVMIQFDLFEAWLLPLKAVLISFFTSFRADIFIYQLCAFSVNIKFNYT